MKIIRTGQLVSAMLMLTFCPWGTARAQTWNWKSQPGTSVALENDGQAVWRLNCGGDQPKPHFHPVALPDGRVLTWDRPPDHVWHHGLWFSWKFINGLNYWEPDRATGT